MKLSRVLGGLLAACPLAAGIAAAEDGPGSDNKVLVLGLRLPQTAVETGTAVTVIDKAEIERKALVFAADAIAAAPGIAESRTGAFGGVSSVRIRGNATGQTLVLVDGVAVNDPSSPGGGYDFGTLDVFGVDRIEILRGPQSTLWGGDAIGGVVSIVTERPDAPFSWRGLAEAGSFGALRAGGSLAGKGERADGRIGFVVQSADGISKADRADGNTEKDGYDNITATGRGGYQFTDAVRAEATFRYSSSDYDFDGFPPPAYVLADSDERTEAEEWSGAISLFADAFAGRLKNQLQVSHADISRDNFDGDLLTSSNEGTRTGYRYSGLLGLADGHDLMFGAEREESEADGQEADTDSLFAAYAWTPLSGLVLTGGLRYDDDDRYGSETTAKVSASWQASDSVRLRASWGQGFKPPTIFQATYICAFCGLSEPNANLKAETSEGFDVGIDVQLGVVEASLTAFSQETENLVDFSYTEGYANIAHAEQQGVEASARAPLGRFLELNAAYTYIDAEDGDGNPLARVPEHSGSVELATAFAGRANASVAVRYNSEQPDGFGPDVSEWTRVDVAGSWRFSEEAEGYLRIENVFDEDYQQVGGYGAPGVSFRIGLRVRG